MDALGDSITAPDIVNLFLDIAMPGSRGQAEWWATVQSFLEGAYGRKDVIKAIKASIDIGMTEELDKYKDV